MQTLDEFKRERLEALENQFQYDYYAGFSKELKDFTLETIDLLNQRTKEVVETIIGEDEINHAEFGTKRWSEIEYANSLRKAQRLRARTLLKEEI